MGIVTCHARGRDVITDLNAPLSIIAGLVGEHGEAQSQIGDLD